MSDYGSVTQCPKCKTSFHVGPAQLEAARGRVRCGGCLNVFDAREYFIVEQKPLFGGQPASSENTLEANSANFHGVQADSEPKVKFQDLQEADLDSDSEAISASLEDDWGQESEMDIDMDGEDSEEVFFNPRADDDEDIFPPPNPEVQQELEEEEEVASNTHEADLEDGPLKEDTEEKAEIEIKAGSDAETDLEESELADSEEAEEEPHIEDIDMPDGAIAEESVEEPESKTPPDTDEWISVIPERSGLHAPEPEIALPKKPEPSEEEQLVEQLFVGSETRSRIQPASIGWLAAIAALVVVLVIQSLYWQPASLREFPFYAQMSESFCDQFLCREVVLQDISQLEVSGIVRPSNEYHNSLSVQIELRNRAESSQYFPHIELAFSDLRGETISLRRFGPQEYLRAETAGRTLMAPYQRVQIEFELYDPGASAISYEFSLRYLN